MTEQIRYLTPGWRDEAEKRHFQFTCPKEISPTTSLSGFLPPCRAGEPLYVFPLTIDEIK